VAAVLATVLVAMAVPEAFAAAPAAPGVAAAPPAGGPEDVPPAALPPATAPSADVENERLSPAAPSPDSAGAGQVTSPDPLKLVAVTWTGPTPERIEMRSRLDSGRFGAWTPVDPVDTARDGRAATGTEPVWVADSREVQVRATTDGQPVTDRVALTSIDPGVGSNDARIAAASAAPGGATGTPSRPAMVTRAQWGADESLMTWPPERTTVRAVTVHHTAGTNDYTAADSAAIVRGIYTYHAKTQGWGDIGYNALVDKFGTVFEGRTGGFENGIIGAHAGGFNRETSGISMMGDYTNVGPSAATLEAVAQLTAYKLGGTYRDPNSTVTLTSTGGGTSRYPAGATVTVPTVFAHRDVGNTECPGNIGYTAMPGIRARAAALSTTEPPATDGPARLLDTRAGMPTVDGRFAGQGKVPAGGSVALQVAGRAQVPAAGARTVVLTVTGTNPTQPTYLTAWPHGQPRPNASAVNLSPGQTAANTVLVQVGADGIVDLFNSAGTTDVIVDVAEWFPADSPMIPGVPRRLLDTRPGNATFDNGFAGGGPLRAGGAVDLQVDQRAFTDLPAGSSVVLNVTAVNPTASTFVTAWPTGAPRPTASNLNVAPGQINPNSVMVPVGANGRISLFNNAGSVDLIADLMAVVAPNPTIRSVTPARLFETRAGLSTTDGRQNGGGKIGQGQTRTLTVAGRGTVPAAGVSSVVVNLTGIAPSAATFLTAWPAGTRPGTSNVNLATGEVRAGFAVVPVAPDGTIQIYNNAGSTDLAVDVLGYVVG
jgi:hypothetical protein